MSAIPSDEVAEDYRNSLDDLITNDRYAISNLTLIAKENIEHAEAISRVLQNHIQRVPPPRKLPALYVLDSIVKNVGTPYTVYFGRNLHQIFMLAYSQVDQNVRRKLEEMLKTWREPVPGSLSTMPVFPTPSTQPIVDALNRFRAAAPPPPPRPVSRPQNGIRITQPQYATPPPNVPYQYQQQQQTQNIQHSPPQYQAPYQQYPQTTYQQPTSHYQTHTPQSQYQSTTPQPQYQPPAPQPEYHAPTPQSQYPPTVSTTQYQQPATQIRPTSSSGAIDMKKLHEDIDDLTIDAKIECSTSPMDQGAQKKLASLQSLKDILDNNAISEADLVAIRDSVMQQMAKKMAPHRPTPPIPQPYHNPYPGSQHYPVQQPVQHQPPQSTTPSLINSTNLAELLRATANRGHQQNGSIPSIQFPQGNPYTSTPPMQNATPAPPAAENPLLAQLRASGLLTGLSTPPNGSAGITPTAGTPSHYEPPVQFTTSSIRTSRPGLLQAFLSRNPNQCSTCGRRFASDEIGTEKKARHLDWHFKTKNRMLEAERRGVSRSWYVDEREWIASREVDDDQEVEGVNRKGNGNGDAKVEVDWVRAPTDSGVRCPIDQEGWKSEWSEELQEFVWRDAVMVGGRYYHMSCYRDLMRAQAQTRERVGTPDSVLGKRGREDDGNGTLPGSGVKKERFKLEV